MGITSSRTIIPIKEAHFKLGQALTVRLEKAYERITGSMDGEARLLDIKAFQRHFLEAFPLMPKVLVEALFDAFGSNRRGTVSLEEFICAVAVMHMGKAPEQLRMLFEVYDIRRTSVIEAAHVGRLLDAIYGREHAKTIDVALEWLFRRSSREEEMDAEEFITRLKPVVEYRGTAAAAQAEPLLAWFRVLCTRILHEADPAVVALEQKYNPDRDLNKVATKYKLSPAVTNMLYQRHALICRRSSTNALDVQEWLSVVGYLIPEGMARRVFQFFAQSGGLAWTAADFITFLCVCVLDSRQEHMSMMFQLFDVDRDGLLTEDEVAAMLENLATYHAHRAASRGTGYGASGLGSGGSGAGGGGRGHSSRHHGHVHYHNDQASIVLGLRKLGCEEGQACDNGNALKNPDVRFDSAARSSTRDMVNAVARQLLRDMHATSDKYVAFPASPGPGSRKVWSPPPPPQRLGEATRGRQRKDERGSESGEKRGLEERDVLPAGVRKGGGFSAADGGVASAAGDHGGDEDEDAGENAALDEKAGGGLTFAGFMAWSSVHGGRMKLMKDLLYACLADFGMRPAKAVQERDVVQEIFQRHEAALGHSEGFLYGPEGTPWAVINAQWWAQWREYARIPSETQRPRSQPSERILNSRQIATAPSTPNTSGSSGSRTADPSPTSSTRSRASSRMFGSTPVLGGGGGGGGGSSGRTSRVAAVGRGSGGPGGGSRAVGGGVAGGGGTGGAAGASGVVSAYLSAASSSSTVTQSPRPGKIDNGPLMEQTASRRLSRTARLSQDFEIIPPKAWDALQLWYDGGPPLERRVINYHGRLQLELYPWSLKVAMCDVKGKPRPFEREMLLSKVSKVSDLTKQLAEANKVEPERARLWNYADRVDWKKQHVLSPGDTLEDAKLLDGQLVLLEISQQDGAWPRSQLQSMFEAEEEEAQEGRTVSTDNKKGIIGDGLVGLGNLGNTCYINSSVQCLSHTPLLTEYFLSEAYVNDVNVDNKLGLQGRLAHVYADLVNDLWSPTKKTVNPKSFKNELAKFNDLFGGHDQHDAQELLAFLLNGLNEDLNRIADKPYIEQPDSDGRPDAELADIWWKNHLRREFSIVVALFAGQFKSLLACRECGYESARFEPFMFLQLPLPEDTERSVVVIVVLLDGARCPAKVSLRLPKTGRVSDLMRATADTFNAPPTERSRRASHRGSGGATGGAGSLSASSDDEAVGAGAATPPSEEQAPVSSEEEEEDSLEEEEDSLEEERRFYTRLGLRCENLAVVDIGAHKIFSTVGPDRTLQSIRETEVYYVYQLERDVYAEKQAAAAEAAAAAAVAAAAVASAKTRHPAAKRGDVDVLEDSRDSRESPPGPSRDLSPGPVPEGEVAAARDGTLDSRGAANHHGAVGAPSGSKARGQRLEQSGDDRAEGDESRPAASAVAFEGASHAAMDDTGLGPEAPQPGAVNANGANGGEIIAADTAKPVRPGVRVDTSGRDDGAPYPHDDAEGAGASMVATDDERNASATPSASSDTAAAVTEVVPVAAAAPPPPPPPVPKQIRMPARLFAVLHRRLEKHRNYLASPYRLEVFGTPLVCRVVPMTGRQLYDKLYRRFHRFLRLKAGGSVLGSAASPARPSAHGRTSGGQARRREQRAFTIRAGESPEAGGVHGSAGNHGDGDEHVNDGVQACMGTGEDEDCPQSVRLTSAWVAAGKVNRWGFRLRLVESNGQACSRCKWTEGCVGCFIRPNDEPCPVKPGDSVGVDWHISVIKEHYDMGEAMSCLLHSSLKEHKEIEAKPLSLEKCLDTFTQQEDIKEGYCSRCREFRNASKKMDVWRLPPILAIQLKRFQYTQYSRRKLRNNVHFPVNGLDLSPYVVKDPGGGTAIDSPPSESSSADSPPSGRQQPRTPPARGEQRSTLATPVATSPAIDSTAAGEESVAASATKPLMRPESAAEAASAGGSAAAARASSRSSTSYGDVVTATAAAEAVAAPAARGDGARWERGASSAARRAGRRVWDTVVGVPSESAGADASSIVAGAASVGVGLEIAGGQGGVQTTSPSGDEDEEEETEERIEPESAIVASPGVIGANGGRGDSLYDLYAVVHHLGALSSGHYVASVKSQTTSKWHYFNDNQVTEVEDELGSSSSSAYILFYMRRDCHGHRIEDLYPSGPPKTVEEVEALMLHRDASKCAIM